jgi:hypothetical protein
MKKYLAGSFAIVLALTFMAFKPQQKQPKADEDPLMWYLVDNAGLYLDNYQSAINSSPETRTEFLGDDDNPCTEGDNKDCVRGFDPLVHLPQSATDTGQEETIRRE